MTTHAFFPLGFWAVAVYHANEEKRPGLARPVASPRQRPALQTRNILDLSARSSAPLGACHPPSRVRQWGLREGAPPARRSGAAL